MKKNGFTLIELLAVIVVLAIIALIATPIVMNTIKSAKKGAAERSADSYIGAVETAIATAKLDGKDIPDGTYNIDDEGNLTGESLSNGKLTIDMKGNKPKSGTITIKNGQVTNDSTMTVGDYDFIYNQDNVKYEAKELYKGKLCTKVVTPDYYNLYIGDTFTCNFIDDDTSNNLTFYLLEIHEDKVSLIMNANVGNDGKAVMDSTNNSNVAWVTEEDYKAAGGKDLSNDNGECEYGGHCVTTEFGPITAKKALKANTSSWTKLLFTQISLPTGQQLADATGVTANGDTYKSTKLGGQLYSNLDTTNGIFGYWTSTPSKTYVGNAWKVDTDGYLYGQNAQNDSYGVRPVVTILKSNLFFKDDVNNGVRDS